ncbi:MAG: hypothetical protein GJV46_06360 [Geobacter sp.]|nr:hypothetical protein [Geobacter sp.]
MQRTDEVAVNTGEKVGSRQRSFRLRGSLLSLLLAVMVMMLCPGCSEKKNPPQPQRADLQPVVSWLKQYYLKTPLNKGWKVTSVTSQGNQAEIVVAIPPDQSSEIKRQPADDQFRLVAEQVCPKNGAALRQILPAGSSVMVLPSVSGQVFIEVACAL